MKTPNIDREIRARIEGFVSTLSKLVKDAAVESVNWALSGGGPSARRPGAARAPARGRAAGAGPEKRGKRGKRSSADVDATAAVVLAYVRTHPGQRLEEIGRGLKVATQGLKLPISKLLAAKRLRTTGQKRGTKYFTGGGGGSGVSKPAAKSTKRKPGKRAVKRSGKRSSKRAAKPAAAGAAPIPVPPPTGVLAA